MVARTVDEYVALADRWGDEIARLREIVLGTGLDETVKWGSPCNTRDGSNVVGIGAFKSYFGRWFFQAGFQSGGAIAVPVAIAVEIVDIQR